ncbi:AraC-type DNA-binding protein [Bradyrhizobium canariense]|uniref:AraC-type DNA-binding protein n=2 Tax=Bradyrhizobium canariense TaxID=255045 RepID=A0A1H1PGA3_9BRAD|nr:AraC-type DNA-binding protein [Bradyrhizobium canariense]
MVVVSGSRSFHVNGSTVTVSAGQAAFIPAGMLHTPIATSDDETVCLNAYVPAADSGSSLHVFDIQRPRLSASEISLENILRTAAEIPLHRLPAPTVKSDKIKLGTTLAHNFRRIGEIAASFDRSREGFSRLVTRELGIAPHAFRILLRLNRARQLLRDGQPIAAVAADTGFSDQSHLTRLFRMTFGTTPGLYRHS